MSQDFPRPSDPFRGTRVTATRRPRALVPTLVVLGILAVLYGVLVSFWTDWLWFDSVGFRQVFTTALATRVGLFVFFGALCLTLFLGITGQDVDADVAELYGLPVDSGAVVATVAPGTPAEEAGLQRGDIITAIDGDTVRSMQELAGRIQRYAPGDAVTLTVQRGTEELTLDVTLGEQPAQQPIG